MVKIIFLIVFILLTSTKQNVFSQSATDRKQQYAFIGNFPLENGTEIIDCKIGYRTFGKLNAIRSNAVIYPTGGGGTTAMFEMFGVGKDVDTTKFYLILIDALGNGVSSSPSNSVSQPKTLFPQFSIRDMVNSQYKMLTEKMNIHHLAAVVGSSMGGLQALQWAVSHPDFMDKVVAIEATPKLSPYDLLWMNTYLEAVKNDTAYHDGNYKTNPVLPVSSLLFQLVMTTPENLNNTVPVDSFYTWFAAVQKNLIDIDCNDWIWQIKAILTHDIGAKLGSLENAAKRIEAKMLIINNKQDHIVNSALSIKFAGMVNAKLIVMDSELGHGVVFEKTPLEATWAFLTQ
jgi:homoserine O-acetyltransferase